MELEDLGGHEAAPSVQGQRRLVVLGDHGVSLDLAAGDDGGDEPADELAAEALALLALVDGHGQHLGSPAHARTGRRSVSQGLEHLAPRPHERADGGDCGGCSVVDQELPVEGAGRVGAGDESDDSFRPGLVLDGDEQQAAVP